MIHACVTVSPRVASEHAGEDEKSWLRCSAPKCIPVALNLDQQQASTYGKVATPISSLPRPAAHMPKPSSC